MYPFVSAHVPRAYMATGENPSGETKVPVIITATFICCIIPTALTAMRIYVRHHLLHQLGKDDFLVIAALVVLWLNGGIGLWAMKHGFGRRDLDAVREGMDMRQLRFLSIFGPIFYHTSCAIIQNSLLTFYDRLRFTHSSLAIRLFSILLRVLSIINALVPICFTIIMYTSPTPEKYFFALIIMWYINASLTLFIDLAIWSLPLPMLNRLENVRGRKKVALIATFSIGLVGCAATVVRLVMLEKIITGGGKDVFFGPCVTIHIMSMTEVGVGVVCVSMATLRPLMTKWGVFSSRGEGSAQEDVQGSGGRGSKRGRCACEMNRGHRASCRIKSQSGIGGKFSRGTSGTGTTLFTGNTLESSFSCTITAPGGDRKREEEKLHMPGSPGGGDAASEFEFDEGGHPQTMEVGNYNNVCVPDIELGTLPSHPLPTATTSSSPTTNNNHTRRHLVILRTLTVETRRDVNPQHNTNTSPYTQGRASAGGGGHAQHRSESTTSLTAVPVN